MIYNRGAAQGGMGGRPPPQKLAAYEAKLAYSRLTKMQKFARCRVRPQDETRAAPAKDSFLRALREVAPEMELFLENHGQYIKNFVIKLIYIQSCTFRHFTKKLYLEEYV